MSSPQFAHVLLIFYSAGCCTSSSRNPECAGRSSRWVFFWRQTHHRKDGLLPHYVCGGEWFASFPHLSSVIFIFILHYPYIQYNISRFTGIFRQATNLERRFENYCQMARPITCWRSRFYFVRDGCQSYQNRVSVKSISIYYLI